MRTGSSHRSLRPDDFLLSTDSGSLFGRSRTGYCFSGGAVSGSFADRHGAKRIKVPGELPDLAPGGSILDDTIDYRIPIDSLARVQHCPSLLILVRLSF